MSDFTFLFPGQGSQYVGMGEKLFSEPVFKEAFEEANDALGFSISQICLEGPEEKLKLTEFTQPAIVTHSVAMNRLLTQRTGKKPTRVLGHSVGEYSALVCAGALNLGDAVRAVNLRGKAMQNAVPVGKGKMIAVLKVPQEKVVEACQSASVGDSQVMAANFNDPNQIVISGHGDACDRAVALLKEGGQRLRAVELPVSAPFHSSLMKPAETEMAAFFDTLTIQETKIPYIANIDAEEYPEGTSSEQIKSNLVKQICGSVRWTQSIEKCPSSTTFFEVGPGKVLTGLTKKIQESPRVFTLDTLEDWGEMENE